MRRRIFFMVPTIELCHQVLAELRSVGITDNHTHVVARHGTNLEGIHKATAFQKTELLHGIGLGFLVGGAAGLVGGLLAITFPPAGLQLDSTTLALVAMTLAGAGFGSLVSALVASDIPNHELEDFQVRIMQGQILIILDVLQEDVDAIVAVIKSHHPEAEVDVVVPD